MNHEFPQAVPEIPVENIDRAADYYIQHLGFKLDWGDQGGEGIAGISRGHCRLYLTHPGLRKFYGNAAPVVIWINLFSIAHVNALHQEWLGNGAKIVSPPESKPWNLHEFTAADLDGNLLRVFYDFSIDVGARRAEP